MVGGGRCVLEGTEGRAPQWYFEGVLEIQEIFDKWARTRAEEGWGFVDRREALRKGNGKGGNREFQIQYSRKSIVSNHSSQLREAEIAFGHFFFFFLFSLVIFLLFYLHGALNGLSSVKKKKKPQKIVARKEMFFAQIAGWFSESSKFFGPIFSLAETSVRN